MASSQIPTNMGVHQFSRSFYGMGGASWNPLTDLVAGMVYMVAYAANNFMTFLSSILENRC